MDLRGKRSFATARLPTCFSHLQYDLVRRVRVSRPFSVHECFFVCVCVYMCVCKFGIPHPAATRWYYYNGNSITAALFQRDCHRLTGRHSVGSWLSSENKDPRVAEAGPGLHGGRTPTEVVNYRTCQGPRSIGRDGNCGLTG